MSIYLSGAENVWIVQFKQATWHNRVFFFSFVGTVLLHVYFQSVRLWGGVDALFASEIFLTRLGELVLLQVTCLCTLVTALIAMKGLLSTVSEHMLIQASWPCTFIAADS